MSTEDRKQPNEGMAEIITSLRAFGQQLTEGMQKFQRVFDEIVKNAGPFFANLQANIKAIPGRTIAAQQTLARRGWFLPPKAPAMSFINLIEERNASGQLNDYALKVHRFRRD